MNALMSRLPDAPAGSVTALLLVQAYCGPPTQVKSAERNVADASAGSASEKEITPWYAPGPVLTYRVSKTQLYPAPLLAQGLALFSILRLLRSREQSAAGILATAMEVSSLGSVFSSLPLTGSSMWATAGTRQRSDLAMAAGVVTLTSAPTEPPGDRFTVPTLLQFSVDPPVHLKVEETTDADAPLGTASENAMGPR
jgi:hypothetical protein